MPNCTRLAPSLAVEALDDPPALFLFSEHRQHVFEGPVFPLLAPLLDGQLALPEIAARLADRVPVQDVYQAVFRLMRRGCLVPGAVPAAGLEGGASRLHDAGADGAAGRAAFWHALGVSQPESDAALAGTSVRLELLGLAEADDFARALEQAGLAVRADGRLRLVATDSYLRGELEEINRQSLDGGGDWMLVKPVGAVIWIGPYFRPGESGCWKCLERRLRGNRQLEGYCLERGGFAFHAAARRAGLPSTRRGAMSLAAIELARTLAKANPSGLVDRVLSLDLLAMRLEEHRLVKRPQCSACGAEERRTLAPSRIALQSQPKRCGHRSADPSEVFERFRQHVSPITGAVSSLHSRGTDALGISHNYTAGHFFPVPDGDVRVMQENFIARSGGKGVTENEARTSALCEALERLSGIRWGEEQVIRGRFAELRGEAIHPRELLHFSERQYADRQAWNASILSIQQYVPDPLPDDAPIAWSAAWSLRDEAFRYLPAGYCYYGHRDPGCDFVRCDSNGTAAGSNLEEAILQGFLELAERDAVAIWWYNRVRRPAVDAESFGLDYWEKMRRLYEEQLQRDLHVLDLTSDLGIATFAVVSRRRGREAEDIIVGFAAHLDPRTALLRALVEASQYLPALSLVRPDGTTRYHTVNTREVVRWWETARFENQPYLVPDADCGPRTATDFPQLASDDLRVDVETCLRICKGLGLELLVVDQTRPDIELPVVKVVVPGLRHFWRRLAPGRLYDVPVQLGWLSQPTSEDQLNPVSCFV